MPSLLNNLEASSEIWGQDKHTLLLRTELGRNGATSAGSASDSRLGSDIKRWKGHSQWDPSEEITESILSYQVR